MSEEQTPPRKFFTTHKGSWNRANPEAWDKASYWSPENVAKRKAEAEAKTFAAGVVERLEDTNFKSPQLVRLADVLDEEEMAFLGNVMANAGGKMRDCSWSKDREKPLWKRLEELNLITAVGSYSWVPTDKIILCTENPS